MKKILLLIVLINIFTYANSKKILIINSYSRDFEWTENQLRGIENYFYGKENIDFFYEYLDNKNIDSEEYLEQYKKIFKEKYKNQTLDLIVTTDDFALSFIRDNYSLLKKVPYVIASGVNHEFPIEENVTILYEKFNIEKNLNLIKKQNSQINTIYFVADSSYSSKGLIEDVKKITDNDKRYEYIWLDEDFFKLKKELKKLKENSAIIHLIYFKDEQGITSKYERTLRELYKDIRIPVYTSFNFYLEEENNVLGGYSIDGYKMGETVGKLVEDYFNGKELSHTIVDSRLYSTYKFNYKVLEKNKIKYTPREAEILFKEISYFESRKYELLAISLLILVSGFKIYSNKKDFRVQLQINEKNTEIMELNENLLETQKEIITVLGQIIENRSEETANHTKRVAKISKFIARLLGFSEEDAQLIEIASPLHDVGKIGIPETVLHKPGKLTVEEFDIVKTHAVIGYEILKKSKIHTLNIAANIAHEHHERWDGKGYPRGIKNENINIYARITTVADIFDALLSRRIYKEPWTIDEVIEYFETEKGKIFDPYIVELFLENIDKVIEIREEAK